MDKGCWIECDVCDGDGGGWFDHWRTCPECEGMGGFFTDDAIQAKPELADIELLS